MSAFIFCNNIPNTKHLADFKIQYITSKSIHVQGMAQRGDGYIMCVAKGQKLSIKIILTRFVYA